MEEEKESRKEEEKCQRPAKYKKYTLEEKRSFIALAKSPN